MIAFLFASLAAFMFFVTWNLLWGLLVIKLYNPKVPSLVYWLGILVLAVLSFLLPSQSSLLIWFPGGVFVSVTAAIAFLTVMPPSTLQQEKLEKQAAEIPTLSRKELQQLISLAEDVEEKQEIYFTQVKKAAALWARKSKELAQKNFVFLSLLLLGIWLLDYAVLLYFSDVFLNLWQESNRQVAELLQQPLADVEKISHWPLRYSAAIVFVFNAFSVMLVSAIVPKMATYNRAEASKIEISALARKNQNARLLAMPSYVSLFKIPEPWIFVFLGFAAAFIINRYVVLPTVVGLVIENALIISAFFYVLNGASIIYTYLQVRLLPVVWLFTGITFLSILAQEFLLSSLFFSFFIGAADFWFNFRQKALHPTLADGQ